MPRKGGDHVIPRVSAAAFGRAQFLRRLGVAAPGMAAMLLVGEYWSMPAGAQTTPAAAQSPGVARAFEPRTVIPTSLPPMINPPLVSAVKADQVLHESELVPGVSHEGESRAYPIKIKMLTGPRREFINDSLARQPIAASWSMIKRTAGGMRGERLLQAKCGKRKLRRWWGLLPFAVRGLIFIRTPRSGPLPDARPRCPTTS